MIVFQGLSPSQEARAAIDTESREHLKPHHPGDRVMVVSAAWFKRWCDFTGCEYDPKARKLVQKRTEDDAEQQHTNTDNQCSASDKKPGPIDSSDLIDITAPPGDFSTEELRTVSPLRPGLVEKKDFWILHEATWHLLKQWYAHFLLYVLFCCQSLTHGHKYNKKKVRSNWPRDLSSIYIPGPA